MSFDNYWSLISFFYFPSRCSDPSCSLPRPPWPSWPSWWWGGSPSPRRSWRRRTRHYTSTRRRLRLCPLCAGTPGPRPWRASLRCLLPSLICGENLLRNVGRTKYLCLSELDQSGFLMLCPRALGCQCWLCLVSRLLWVISNPVCVGAWRHSIDLVTSTRHWHSLSHWDHTTLAW